jgi:DNA mismatch repair protein MutS
MDTTLSSLLWPQNQNNYSSKVRRLSSEAIDSLNLNEICNNIAENEQQSKIIKDIITNMCFDEEVIKYRQDIFKDMISSNQLMDSIADILKHLENLKYITIKSSIPEEVDLWRLFSRFKELESYVDCITSIMKNLAGIDLKSKGLNQLRDTIRNIYEDENFKALSVMVKNLGMEISDIKSLTLGINLDESLNPVEATLVSINKTKFKDNNFFRIILPNHIISSRDLGIPSKIHQVSPDRRDPVMYNLYRDIERFLNPVLKDLSSGLKNYACIKGGSLVALIPELIFYYRCAVIYKLLEKKGMPLCMPEIIDLEERKCTIEDVYNVSLALHMINKNQDPAKNLVLNNVKFDESGRIFILTGPNRGGKTVYTEAIGISQILFQAGIFVPGRCASISPVDSVFVHFPVDEKKTVEFGRLGEEAQRLHIIFKEATKYSLILLNEPLASTSFTEGLYIAKDVVKALRYLGARIVYNTHMHELAAHADEINSDVEGDSKVISLVTGMVDGKRSYKVYQGEPLGKSYAFDIAKKYGISYNQIIETIDKNLTVNYV